MIKILSDMVYYLTYHDGICSIFFITYDIAAYIHNI